MILILVDNLRFFRFLNSLKHFEIGHTLNKRANMSHKLNIYCYMKQKQSKKAAFH